MPHVMPTTYIIISLHVNVFTYIVCIVTVITIDCALCFFVACLSFEDECTIYLLTFMYIQTTTNNYACDFLHFYGYSTLFTFELANMGKLTRFAVQCSTKSTILSQLLWFSYSNLYGIFAYWFVLSSQSIKFPDRSIKTLGKLDCANEQLQLHEKNYQGFSIPW